MNAGDITDPLTKLLDDVVEAEKYLTQNDSQFTRRAYIRAAFAYIEGAIWILKQTCLKLVLEQKAVILTHADFALLSDVTYDLKDNGTPFEQVKFLRLPENVRFAFRIFDQLFSYKIDLGVGTKKWGLFKKTVSVRHRITHPKEPNDLDISEEEIKAAIQVCRWFNKQMLDCVKFLTKD